MLFYILLVFRQVIQKRSRQLKMCFAKGAKNRYQLDQSSQILAILNQHQVYVPSLKLSLPWKLASSHQILTSILLEKILMHSSTEKSRYYLSDFVIFNFYQIESTTLVSDVSVSYHQMTTQLPPPTKMLKTQKSTYVLLKSLTLPSCQRTA